MRSIRSAVLTSFLLAGSFLLAATAQADIKVVLKITTDIPALRAKLANNPQAQQMMSALGLSGNGITMVIYGSGPRSRVDFGNIISSISDKKTSTVIMVNRMLHSYSSTSTPPGTASPRVTYRATGRTKTILGHLCREYTGKDITANGGVSSVDAWTAADLPTISYDSGLGSGASALPAGLKGIPLSLTAKSSGPMGPMTVHLQATSISRGAISASVFSVPSGYTLTAGGGMFPGMGAGMPSAGGSGQ